MRGPYAGSGVIGAGVVSGYPHAERLRVLQSDLYCTLPCCHLAPAHAALGSTSDVAAVRRPPLRPGPETSNAPWHHCGKVPGQSLPWPDRRSPVHSPAVPFIKASLPTPTHLEHGYIFALNCLHDHLSTTHQGPIVLSIHNHHHHHHHHLSIDSRLPSRPTPTDHVPDPNPPCLRIDPDKRLPTSTLSRPRRPIPRPIRICRPARLPDRPPGTAWILRSGQPSRSPSSGACGVRGPRRSPRPTTRALWAWFRSAPTSTTAIAAQRWLATPEAEASPSSSHALRGVATIWTRTTTPDMFVDGPVEAESEPEF